MYPVNAVDSQPHWRWSEYSPEQTLKAREQTEAKIVREQLRMKAVSANKKLKAMRKASNQDLKNDILAAVQRAKEKKS